MRILLAIAAATMLSACSTSHPTAPSAALATPERHPFTGNLTGQWKGTYTITGCSPTNAPNQCTWYIPGQPQQMRLQLTQNGAELTGSFTSERLGADSVAVTGHVDEFGAVTLAGTRRGEYRCFFGGARDLAIESWKAEVTKQGGLAGSFRQLVQQTLSSCYTSMYSYDSTIVSLTRP